jgi:subtilase family serine protease
VSWTIRARSSSARRFSTEALETLETRALLSHAAVSIALAVPHVAHPQGAQIGGFVTVPNPNPNPNRSHARPQEHHGLVGHGSSSQVAPASLIVTPLLGSSPMRSKAKPKPKPKKPPTPPPIPVIAAPYTPAQVRHAYGIDQLGLTGAGQIIAIVDAYDDPTIASDLHHFDQAFGLPDPAFVKAVPRTGKPAFDAGWAGEIALDVEWAHAVAPGATILLVEAASSSFNDLLSAVDYAVASGAKQVSMSWGGSASFGLSSFDSHFNHPGVTFTASSGDSGAGVSYPAASPWVTAVGGTSLTLGSGGNRLNETAWYGSGGGTTSGESRPGYQSGFVSGYSRGVPDVSYNADPYTGYRVYDSSSGGSWYQVGGTSAGAPQWAGLVALANQGRAALGKSSLGTGLTYGTNQVLYSLAGGGSYSNIRGDFLDVTSGGNGYPASAGWDRVTGLGSPVANKLVPDLVQA